MARSKPAYRITGRFIQLVGFAVAVCGLIAGLTDVWNEPVFSRVAGGVIVLAGVALSITAEAFLLLYAIEENTREAKRILEYLRKLHEGKVSGDAEVAAASAEAPSKGSGEHSNIVECPECGCPIRAGKTECPACGKRLSSSRSD